MQTHTLMVTRCQGSTVRVAHGLVASRRVSVVVDGVTFEIRPGGSITAVLVIAMTPGRTVLALRRAAIGPWLRCSSDGLSHTVSVNTDRRDIIRRVYEPAIFARQLEEAPGCKGKPY